MNFYCVARFPLDHDMQPLRSALDDAKCPYRFVEENNSILLWVAEAVHPDQVSDLIKKAYAGQGVDASATDESVSHTQGVDSQLLPSANKTIQAMKTVPMTLVLIALGLAGYAAFKLPMLVVIEALTFTPTQIAGAQLFIAKWQWAEVWRLVTPCFLHLSLPHIAFNGAAMLQVGSRLEVSLGSLLYLVICLIIGVAGNVVQYSIAGPSLFGGLSGIVFGLFTFNGMLQRYAPDKALLLPKGAYVFLLVWLVAGFTPVFEVLLGVQMGNGAHLGGAIAGLVLAYFYCLHLKRLRNTVNDEPK